MSQRVTLCSEVKFVERSRSESESEQGDIVAGSRPETGRSIHGQGEARVTPRGGPNPLALKSQGMSCGSE